MLITDLGEIIVTVDGVTQQLQPLKLKNVEKRYAVDGRYKIIVNLGEASANVSIACTLVNQPFIDLTRVIESGERLALISFYHQKTKLSIGVEEGRPKTVCEHLDNGINITINGNAGIPQIEFYIAWLTMQDEEKEDIFTWFAADPTLS